MSNKSKIYLSSPHMGGQEIRYIEEAFAENWIAPLGPNVDGFEKDVATYIGNVHVAALSTGTAAIHLALIMLGVQADDEVICQSMTFSASANPIAYQNALPVFVDSEPETWNMCPVSLEAAIKDRIEKGKKPKAIIPVHLYGMPANMEAISAVANRYEIPIVEDAAEALGSVYQGKKCGAFGAMAALSFNGNKIITTSGGGALVTADKRYADKARFLSTQARDAAPHYQHSEIGYNYRMSNISAGIGRGQMQVLDERIARRREMFAWYADVFKQIDGVSLTTEPEGSFSNRWLTAILIDPSKTKKKIDREALRLAFEKENIESRPLWKPMHLQPVFRSSPYYGDNRVCEKLFENGLCLPSGSNLTSAEKDRIFAVIDELFS